MIIEKNESLLYAHILFQNQFIGFSPTLYKSLWLINVNMAKHANVNIEQLEGSNFKAIVALVNQ